MFGSRLARLCVYVLALAGGGSLAHFEREQRLHAPAPTVAAQRVREALAPQVARAAEVEAPSAPEPTASVRPVPAIAPSELPIAEREALFRDGMVIDGATPHRLILFTFDDGPDRRSTPLLLDRLDAAGVKAVFFLTANRIASRTPMEREHATIAREILARGHIIGNHTLDHLQLPLLDDTGVAQQLGGAEDVFQNVLGIHPSLLRPPGGARSPRIDELLAQRGYTTVLWNLSTGDDQVRTAREVFDVWVKVMERREREDGERGGIVLLHDTNSWSVDAFQMIWGELMARNCKLLARGEELYDVVPDPSFFYQPRGDAPAGFVAAAAAPDAQVLAERQARLRVDAAQRCAAIDGF